MANINQHIIKAENYTGQKQVKCPDCGELITVMFYADIHDNTDGSQSWLHAVEDTDIWAHSFKHNTKGL